MSIAAQLTLASSALLGHTVQAAQNDWQVNTGILIYNEGDGRVQAVEPVVELHKIYDDDSTIDIKFLADSLTGASPNGAAKANKVQTFTSASSIGRTKSNGSVQTYTTTSGAQGSTTSFGESEESDITFYDIAAGELPSDPSFKDTRLLFSVNRSKPFANNYTFSFGGAYSHEEDFSSFSLNSALAKDLNQKNTTLSAGINLEYDNIDPFGGVPLQLSSYFDYQNTASSESKSVIDGMLGITQILSRRWLMQLNLALSSASGYQNDPYKIMTVADKGNLMEDPTNSGRYLYVFENRPRNRLKSSLYWQNKVALFNNEAVDVSYRYMQDDWGIQSHTFDSSFHWQLSEHYYLEPHYRYYQQTAADFYAPYLQNGEDVTVTATGVSANIAYGSSDPRLAAFSADTFGVKWAYTPGNEQEFALRVEFYQQHDQNQRRDLPKNSDLYGFDNFAPLSAAWVQLEYSFKW